jgi:lipoate-protein ligase A
MQLLDLTLPTPAENLALDEALLEAAEAGELAADVLRLWEMPQTALILGRSSRASEEVDLVAAQDADIPLLRRPSGGAAVVAGPGCLMYSMVLSYEGREHLRMLDEVHRHVLGIIRTALMPLVSGIEHAAKKGGILLSCGEKDSPLSSIEHVGICDLAIDGRKFSGNSLRCKRDHLLYHGTFLYNFDLPLITRLLKMPPRQPNYRALRTHADFVTNIPIPAETLRASLATAFAATESLESWPSSRMLDLAANRYSQPSWNLQR